MWSRCSLFVALVAIHALVSVSFARTIVHVDDKFSDGNRFDGADPYDIPWYRSLSGMQLSVSNDAVFGTGDALHVDIPSFSGTPAHYVLGTFSPITLGSNPGDKITASFDFHLDGTISSQAHPSLRFGFGNSGGTAVTTDDFTGLGLLGDDSVYGFAVYPDTSTPGGIKRWATPGVGGGSGVGVPFFTTGSFFDLDDPASVHSATWILERLADSSVQVTFGLDDFLAIGLDSSLERIEMFDEISIRGGWTDAVDFSIDNVVITSTTVPEPASGLLLVFASFGMTLNRRKR